MIVVLDTNCLVAGLLTRGGPCAEILDRWRDGQFEVAVSPALLAELESVLQYPRIAAKYRVRRDAAAAAVGELRAQGVLFPDAAAPPRVVPADADDDYVVALAQAGSCRFLVTRDSHFAAVDSVAAGVEVISPEAFLARLRAEDTLEE